MTIDHEHIHLEGDALAKVVQDIDDIGKASNRLYDLLGAAIGACGVDIVSTLKGEISEVDICPLNMMKLPDELRALANKIETFSLKVIPKQ